MTGHLVDMDLVGGGDIAVGQCWKLLVAERRHQVVWTVDHVGHDTVTLRRGDDQLEVTFGALLATWALLVDVERETDR